MNSIVAVREKCLFDGKIVTPCYDLESFTNTGIDPYGIIRFAYVKGRRSGVSRTVYAIKSGLTSKTGVVLVHCPFCGTEIYKETIV